MSGPAVPAGGHDGPANPAESLRVQRHFVALVALVAIVRFLVPPGRVPGAAETWQTVGALWLLGVIWVVIRAPRGRLVGDSVGDIGAQNLAIQALIVFPSVLVGIVRLMGDEAAGAYPANVLVTVVFLPLASLVILTLAALPFLWLGLRARSLLGLGVLLLLVAPGVEAQECQVDTDLQLDHVVLAVPDLGAAGEFFRDALGFTLKPGRPHANSIENLHAKFRDGTEVELLTATEPRDALAAQYLAFLNDGPGLAYLAFRGVELSAAAIRFEDAEFVSNRAFDWLAFPAGHAWHHMFLIDLHASPGDPPEIYEHANTAAALLGVRLSARDLDPEREFLEAFGAAPCGSAPERVALPGGEVELHERSADSGRRLVGVTLEVDDLDAVRGRVLALGGKTYDSPRGSGVSLRHATLGDAELRFVELAE